MITADRTTAVRRNDYFCLWLFYLFSRIKKNKRADSCKWNQPYFFLVTEVSDLTNSKNDLWQQ